MTRRVEVTVSPEYGVWVTLAGAFDLSLDWSPSLSATDTPTLLPLEVAIREQLGLKLERRTEMANVLVIDAINRPSAN